MANVKEPRFINQDDVMRRLDGVIIRYKNIPVYAQYHARKSIIVIDMTKAIESGRNSYVEVDAEDEDLDLSIPPLGYLNVGERGMPYPVYFMRQTPRVTKAGIDLRNIIWKSATGSGRGWQVNPVLKPLGDCIAGDYPQFHQAVEAVRTGRGLAFGRRIALGKIEDIPVVLYRGNTVGLYDLDSNSVLLSKDYISSPAEAVIGQYMGIKYGKEDHV